MDAETKVAIAGLVAFGTYLLLVAGLAIAAIAVIWHFVSKWW